MLKEDLRSKYTNLRSEISREQLLNSSLSIANKLLELPIWSFDYYHIFLPISERNEIDTSFILSILQGKDKNVILPKVFSKNSMKHYLLTDNTKLRTSNWGVPEPVDGIELMPSKIDVVFVPLLVFDQKGNRVGYGKGFYDRFLGECKPEVIKVGLSLFGPEDKIDDVTKNDVPLNYCVTPDSIYSLTSC